MKATATKSTDIIIFAMTITGDIVQSSRLRRVGDGYQVSTVTTVSEPKFTHMSLKKKKFIPLSQVKVVEERVAMLKS